ncbi:MAG TPA: IS200/IS605 family transposase [Ktedonobacterales bacterium]|nr:IS200/IS605 family transposase [Ktedonobacterales bacterium]
MDKQDYPEAWRITYHFVWGPMRSKPCLVGAVAARLAELIAEKASDLPLQTCALAILPDRVYVAAVAPPTVAPHHIVCQLKAHTSRTLREEFPELTRIPTLWTRAYLVLAGEMLTKEDVLRLYEAAQAPRRPRGRPRKPCDTPDAAQ